MTREAHGVFRQAITDNGMRLVIRGWSISKGVVLRAELRVVIASEASDAFRGTWVTCGGYVLLH